MQKKKRPIKVTSILFKLFLKKDNIVSYFLNKKDKKKRKIK